MHRNGLFDQFEVKEILNVCSSALHGVNLGYQFKIVENGKYFAVLLINVLLINLVCQFYSHLDQVVEALLKHDCVVTLESDGGRPVVQRLWYTRPAGVAGTAHALPHYIAAINATLSAECLET